MQSYNFDLFADYFQFYLQDELADGNLENSWTEEEVNMLLALAPSTISVGTARNVHVPVTIEVRQAAPDEDRDSWDQINECSIEINSGRLVVAGCTDYFPEAARIPLEPGTYRARIYYANLGLLNEDGLSGDDKYKVVLWPAPASKLVVIKQRNIQKGR